MTQLKKLFILSFLLVTTLIAAPVMTWIPPYEVDACFNNLKANYGVDQALSHLALQFWEPSGGQVTKDKYAISDTKINEIREFAQSKGIKVMLCVYNGDDGWDWSQATNAFINNRSSFVNSLVAKMEQYQLDGIEIDLEGPQVTAPYDGQQFIAFMKDLSTAVRAKGKELTVATFSSEWHTPGTQHWSQLLPLVDGLTSMGYQEIGMNAAGDLSYARQKAMASAAPEKLMLGMPDNFGTWQGNTISQQVNWVKSDGVVGMALWDLQLRDGGWKNSTVWNTIKSIKGTTGSDNGSGDTGGNNSSAGTATSNMVNWTQWTTAVDDYGTKVTSSSPIVSNGIATVDFSVVASNSGANQYAWAYLESKLPGGASNNLTGVTDVEVTYRSNSDFSMKLAQVGIVEKGEAYMTSLSNTNSQYVTKKIAISSFVQPSWVSSTTPYNGAAVESILFQVDGGNNTKNSSISIKELKLYDYNGDETGSVIAYHTVTPSAGSGGSITPAGPQSVEDDQDITFQIFANDGYEIEDVVVDGVSKGAKSSVTVSAVSKDLSVSASFKISTGGTTTPVGTPVEANGALSVNGRYLVNEKGDPVQLRGMSTHGLQYFEAMYSGKAKAGAICKALAQDWKADVIRISNYVNEGSGWSKYPDNPQKWHDIIDNLVDSAGKYGIYAIIDWHMLYPGDPNHADYNIPGKGAKEFWTYMAQKHGGKEHVIFEVCNEPNDRAAGGSYELPYDVTWSVIKTYAEKMIKIIRDNDPDDKENVVIVGTPTWCQDPNAVIGNLIAEPNIMYTLHFYAATHKPNGYAWNNFKYAISQNVPVFVTEFGTQEASGDGPDSFDFSAQWLDLLKENNVSWVNWNFSNDFRTGAVFVYEPTTDAMYSADYNLKKSGKFIIERMRRPDSWEQQIVYTETSNMLKWASWEAKVDDFGSTIDTVGGLLINNVAKAGYSLVQNDAAANKYAWGAMYASLPKGDNNTLAEVKKIQVRYRSNVDVRLSVPQKAPYDQSGEAYYYLLPASTEYTSKTLTVDYFSQPSWIITPEDGKHDLDLSQVTSVVFNIDGSTESVVSGFFEIDSLTLFNYQGEESGAEVIITEIHKKGLNKTFTTVDSVVLENKDTLVTTTTFNENADTLIHKKDTVENEVVIATEFDTISITLDTVEVSKTTETLTYNPTVTTEVIKDTVTEIIDTTISIDSVVQENLDTVVTTIKTENYRDTICTVTKTFHDGVLFKTERVQDKIELGNREISNETKTLSYQPQVTTKEYEDTVHVIVDTVISVDSVVQGNRDTVVTTVKTEYYNDTIYTVTETYSDGDLSESKREWNRVESKSREIFREEKTLLYVEITTVESEEIVREIIDTTVSIDSVVQDNLDTLVTTIKTENFRDTTFTIVKTYHNGDLVDTERTVKSVVEGSREISKEEKTLPFESGVVITTKEYEDTVREVVDTTVDVVREILVNFDTVVTTVEYENFNDTVYNVIDTFHNDELFDSERTFKEVIADSRVISEKKDTLTYINITTETSEETVREVVDTTVEVTKEVQDNLDTLVTTVTTENFNDSVFTVVKTLHNGEVVETEKSVKEVIQGSQEISREEVTVPYGATAKETTVEEEEILDTTITVDSVILNNEAGDTLVTTTEIESFITHTIKVTDTLLNSEIIGTDRDTLSSVEETRIISEIEDTLFVEVAIKEVDTGKKGGISGLTFAPNPVSKSAQGTFFRVPSDMDGEWTIQIFDALGNLIDEATISSNGGAAYMWDLTNRSGQRVTNGMYVAIISYTDRNGYRKTHKSFIGVRE